MEPKRLTDDELSAIAARELPCTRKRGMSEATLFVRGLVAHLIADWLLQNDWMARCKADLSHPAAWIHSGIQTVALSRVFGWQIAVLMGIAHVLVDTRKPLIWWRGMMRQTTIQINEHAGWHVTIWGDQVVHIVAIWIAAWLKGEGHD
jgi:hypothetical protein